MCELLTALRRIGEAAVPPERPDVRGERARRGVETL